MSRSLSDFFRYTEGMWGSGVTSLGTTMLKEKRVTFGIKDADRLKHVCILGSNGSGRGDFMTRMAFQDIERSLGVVVLDAKGNVAPAMMERFDAQVTSRLIYLDPAEAEHPFSWNILNDIRRLPVETQEKRLVRILESVYQIYGNPFPALLAKDMLAHADSTLVTFYKLLSESGFRKNFFKDNTEKLGALEEAFSKYPDELALIEERGRYIGKDTLMRNVLGQVESKFSLLSLAEGAVVVVNLENIRMFPTRMAPLVRLFTEAARMSSEASAQASMLYLQDSLRHLGEQEIDTAFSSHSVAVTVADTVIKEGEHEKRERVLSRCGSIVSFKTHRLDRPLIERAFYPYVEPEEIEELGEKEFVTTLMVDGVRTRPFFGAAIALARGRSASYQDLITANRTRYTALRRDVDDSFNTDDDEDGTPHRPAGFQDAFRAMFEKRSRAAQGASAPVSAPAPQAEVSSVQKESKPPVSERVRMAGQSESPLGIAEDILKQILYVPTVS
jgi:hypothetical protein